MTSVGVQELRQRASELLRLVERGETIGSRRNPEMERVRRCPTPPGCDTCRRSYTSIIDGLDAKAPKFFEAVTHSFEHLWGVRLPVRDLANNP